VTDRTLEETIFEIQRPRVVTYPRAAALNKELESLHAMPQRDGMPNILVVAEAGNGKTTLVKRHLARHRPELRPSEDAAFYPVIIIDAPPGGSEMLFYLRILKFLGAPPASKHRVEILGRQVCDLLRTVKTRILIIDEFHDILKGTVTKQSYFLAVLKQLHNEVPISIVATGTRAAAHALESDPQLERRFRSFELPTWQLNADFIGLLKSFKGTWNLTFDEESLAPKVLSKAGGTIRQISFLLEKCAVYCAEHGEQKVTSRVLDACGYERHLQ
jgi:type II secretory pathway predicted ATPase ExeA